MARSSVKNSLEIYLREIDASPLLTADEEKELCWKIIQENCPASRDRMIRSNLRLVVNIAKNYMNRGMPLSDLIEEGNLGLMHAVEAFDPDKGARFSTYASWWIKQAIKRALINAGQPVHIPAYMVELIAKWKRASVELEEKFKRPPSTKELAEHLDLSPKKVRMIRKAMKAFSAPRQSLVGNNDEATSLTDLLSDPRTPPPDEQVLYADDLETIRQLLDTIDEREATILRLRFGLDGQEPLTLKEIGKHVDLTRERVRQIEIAALEKLAKRMSSRRPLSSPAVQARMARRNGEERESNPNNDSTTALAAPDDDEDAGTDDREFNAA